MSHLAASTPYVFQRRNTFYFRFTFSRIISKLVGKRELRYSLRTGYRQSAIRRAMGLVVQVERFVWQLQKDTKLWAEIDLKPFNNTEITTLEEHIKRKWADISAETAGEQYTPDDVIALIAEIITLLNSADYCLDAGVHHNSALNQTQELRHLLRHQPMYLLREQECRQSQIDQRPTHIPQTT